MISTYLLSCCLPLGLTHCTSISSTVLVILLLSIRMWSLGLAPCIQRNFSFKSYSSASHLLCHSPTFICHSRLYHRRIYIMLELDRYTVYVLVTYHSSYFSHFFSSLVGLCYCNLWWINLLHFRSLFHQLCTVMTGIRLCASVLFLLTRSTQLRFSTIPILHFCLFPCDFALSPGHPQITLPGVALYLLLLIH